MKEVPEMINPSTGLRFVKSKWSFEKIMTRASTYNTKRDWAKFDSPSYQAAKDRKLLDNQDIVGHMKILARKNTFFSVVRLFINHQEMTPSQFRRRNSSAVAFSERHGFYEKARDKYLNVGGNYASRGIYAIEFVEQKSVYVGLTFNFKKRRLEHINKSSNKYVRYFIESGYSFNFIEKTGYISSEAAKEMEEEILSKYIVSGWIKLNIARTGALGSRISVGAVKKNMSIPRTKSVLMYKLSGEEAGSFDSIIDAARFMSSITGSSVDTCKKSISRCANRQKKTYLDHKWEFKNNQK